MKNLAGKTWGSLTTKQQETLLTKALPVSAIDMSTVKSGECIIDFHGYNFSIPGEVINDEIVINDSAVFYNPMD